MITGAGVFLHNGRKVLLVHEKSSGMWGFPKGCKNPNESNCDCWKRELWEETGINCLPRHKIVRHCDILRYNITEAELHTDYLPSVKAGEEVHTAKWVSIRDATKLHLNAITRKVLTQSAPRDPYRAFASCRRMVRSSEGPRFHCSLQKV